MKRYFVLLTFLAATLASFAVGAPVTAGQCRPVIAHWEITQSIQDEQNSVRLIDGRPTGIRLFLEKSPDCGPGDNIDDATAWLRAYFQGSWILDPVNPVKDGAVQRVHVPDQWGGDRESSEGMLVFEWRSPQLGLSTTATTVWLQACAYEGDVSPSLCDGWRNYTIDLNRRSSPLVAGVQIDYFDHGLPEYAGIAPGEADRMAWAMYPFKGAPGSGDYYFPNVPPVDHDEDIKNWGMPGQFPLMVKLAAVRDSINEQRSGKPVSLIMAWIDGVAPGDYRGIGFKSWGLGWAWDEHDSRFLMAHELGHMFYGPGHPEGSIGVVGWDVLNSTESPFGSRLKPSALEEFMSVDDDGPGNSLYYWINRPHYDATYDEYTEPGIQFSVVPTWPIHGYIDSVGGGQWSVEHVIQMEIYGPQIASSQSGDGEVRVLDQQGLPLYTSAFHINTHEDENGEPVPFAFTVDVPALQNAHTVELLESGSLKTSVQRSPSAPTASITNPQPGQVVDSNTVVEWQASDADGDQLKSHLQYSHDGGVTWVPLGVFMDGNQLQLPADYLASSSSGVIRLLVSDGLNTTVATVSGIQLCCNKMPEVTVVHPSDDEIYPATGNVIFEAYVFDPEDGFLPDDSISWSSSVDGPLATGSAFNTSGLTPGVHVVSCTATDSLGGQFTDSITLTID